MQPRAQGTFLLGAVWLILLTQGTSSFWMKNSQDLLMQEGVNAAEIQRLMNEKVDLFRVELIQGLSSPSSYSRQKRAIFKTSEVTVMDPIPYVNVTFSNNQVNPDMNCFVYNGAHYCFVGENLFSVNDGQFELVLSEFPVQEGDQIKTYVYNSVIYVAIFNKKAGSLQLYFLRRPDETNLHFIQSISGDKLEDCLFFEHSGKFYMALAIQLGPSQYAKDVGIQCIFYEWIGTTMDMVHEIPVENLERIVLFPVGKRRTEGAAEETYLLFVQRGYKVQLWQLKKDKVRGSVLIDIIDIGLTELNQVQNIKVADQNCILFSGRQESPIYCLISNKMLRWQVLYHNYTTSPYAWSAVRLNNLPEGYVSSLLIFQIFDPEIREEQYNFYKSNSSGLFALSSSVGNPSETGCVPQVSIAFLVSASAAQLIQTCTLENSTVLQGYTMPLSESLREEPTPDPLVQCLSDVNSLMEKISVVNGNDFEKNLVTTHDDFSTDGKLIIQELRSLPKSLGPVKVNFDPNEEFKTTKELSEITGNLMDFANDLDKDLPNLISSTNDNNKISGKVTFNQPVTANEVNLPDVNTQNVNEVPWNDYLSGVLRYSIDQDIDHDLTVDKVVVENLTTNSTIGGMDPAKWLLSSGGTLTGAVTFQDVIVDGDVHVKDNRVNGIDMKNVLTKNETELTIAGEKRFRQIFVREETTAPLVNGRKFDAWAKSVALSNFESAPHFSGRVEIEGPVEIRDSLECTSINGLDVPHFPKLLVMKDADQTITGHIRFAKDVLVNQAEIATLNGVKINDLLTTSTLQDVQTRLNVTEIVADGDIDCQDIKNLDFDNLVFGDDSDIIISGPVRFENGVEMINLNFNGGSMLNDLDVEALLNPEMIVVDPAVEVEKEAFIQSLSAPFINGFDVTDLENRYWTKSGDQEVPADLNVANTVRMTGDVKAETFLGRPLDEFLQTKSDERIDADVVFAGPVDVSGQLTVPSDEDGIVIHGVNLGSLDNNVVKKVGQFQVRGTKTLQGLKVLGNLTVKETVNEMKIPEDIALLDRPQQLSNAVFTDVKVDGDVTADGDIKVEQINGIDLENFLKDALVVDADAKLGAVHFENDVSVGDMKIDRINGVDFDDIRRFGLHKSGRGQQNLTELIVNGSLKVQGPVEMDSLNGYNVTEVFSQIVDGSDTQRITGSKTTRNLHVDSDATFDRFNDRPLDFSNILRVTGDQNITGNFTFQNLSAENVVLKAINDVKLSDLIKTTGTEETQIITGDIQVDNATFSGDLRISELKIASLTDERMFNDCKVIKAPDIKTFKHFDSINIVNGSLILTKPSQNNGKLADLTETALKTSEPAVVTGKVRINVPGQTVSMEKLDISDGRLGAIDVNDLLKNSMRKSLEQTITRPMKYADKISVSEPVRSDNFEFTNWNNQPVQEMLDEIVPKSGPHTVNAKKRIHGTWNVRNLDVAGTINGVSVDQFVKTSDQRFPPGTIFSSLTVNQVNSNGLIDGVNVTELVRERVPLSSNSVINSSLTFAADVSSDEVQVNEVNDLPISELVLRTEMPNQVIDGTKLVRGNVEFQGKVILTQLNGRVPEEAAANLVEKDQDAEFELPVTFAGGLEVLERLNFDQYNSNPLDEDLNVLVSKKPVQSKALDADVVMADDVLSRLRKTPNVKFAAFEYFEPVQDVPLDIPFATSPVSKIGSSPISSGMSVIYTIRNSNEEGCGTSETCRCYRTNVLSPDNQGRAKTLRIPSRFREFIESKQVNDSGAKIYVFYRDHTIFVVGSQPFSDDCSRDTAFIAVLDPSNFERQAEIPVDLDSFLSDVVLEQHPDGTVFIAISQSSSNILVYTFDGENITRHQSIEMDGSIALDMTVFNPANSTEDGTLLLAVAVPGLETNSTLWKYADGQFQLMQQLNTIGPMDVLFTTTDASTYLTFAQDPASSDQFGESWSQYSVPARVFRFTEATGRFEMFQKLDVDRVISLTNLNILGMPYMATASRISGVRIHRAVPGQGFQVEQAFQLPDVQSLSGYNVGDQTFLSAVLRNKIQTFVARIRGLKKPSD